MCENVFCDKDNLLLDQWQRTWHALCHFLSFSKIKEDAWKLASQSSCCIDLLVFLFRGFFFCLFVSFTFDELCWKDCCSFNKNNKLFTVSFELVSMKTTFKWVKNLAVCGNVFCDKDSLVLDRWQRTWHAWCHFRSSSEIKEDAWKLAPQCCRYLTPWNPRNEEHSNASPDLDWIYSLRAWHPF